MLAYLFRESCMKPRSTTLIFCFMSSLCFSQVQQPASLSQRQMENLAAFTKLYGYVKYFHPSDEASSISWDTLAIYGAEKVLRAHDTEELNQTLESIFLPIAPSIAIYPSASRYSPALKAISPQNVDSLKIVAWQHFGVGLGDPWRIYRSRRTNRFKTNEIDTTLETSISQDVDAAPYRGKDFLLRGAVKLEGAGCGSALIQLIVFKSVGLGAISEHSSTQPTEMSDWRECEVTGTIDSSASKLTITCFTNPPGKYWFDDIRLYVKEKDKWALVPIENGDFEVGKKGTTPPGWTVDGECTVSDESAFHGSKAIHVNVPPKELGVALFDKVPRVGEYIQRPIGSGLSCWIPLALYSDDQGTIPHGDWGRVQQLKDEMKSRMPQKLDATYLALRLGDIVNAWNVFQHFYPYFDVVKTDWQMALREGLQSAYRDTTPHDFRMTLRKLIAQLKDGHGNVQLLGDLAELRTLPLRCEWVENQLVVTAVYDKTLTDIQLGDVLTYIDGTPSKQAIEKAEEYISSATPQWKRYRSSREIFFGPSQTVVTLTVQDVLQHERDIHVKRSLTLAEYTNMENALKNPPVRVLPGNIYYLNLDRISISEIDSLSQELAQAKKIICDVRGYPNANTLFISHLLNIRDTSTSWMQVPEFIYPDQEQPVGYRRFGWGLVPLTPHFSARVAFLIDGRAISYADAYMSFIEHYKLAEIVGEATAGTDGDINPFRLPGGYRLVWTGAKAVKHDGSQNHGIGILPTIPVKRTMAGVRAGRDEFLEKAIEVLSK
jgi:hypothetical protein